MTTELKVHPSFFREFATKTWVSSTDIVKELVENAFDEDATICMLTILKDGSIVIEDDAGMDQDGMAKFLLLGSPHKKLDRISPRLRRIRTGRYGTGRLSFLTSFEDMKIKTKRDSYEKSIIIDGNALDRLFDGNASLDELHEVPLGRNGSELTLKRSKTKIDSQKLIKEIRKLAILRHPMFEVYIKEVERFKEWDFAGAQRILAPEIQGHKLLLNLEEGKITGEIVIARRPLTEDEQGIAIMIGNHIVTRSNFGFNTRLNRVTGFVRNDTLTSRFADKSAIIEDEEYNKFNQSMKNFVLNTLLPSLTEYEDVLITREESKIYKEIDKVLGQAIVENLETQEEIEGYELVDVDERSEEVKKITASLADDISEDRESPNQPRQSSANIIHQPTGGFESIPTGIRRNQQEVSNEDLFSGTNTMNQNQMFQSKLIAISDPADAKIGKKVTRPMLKRTFALKKVGYKVIPYEDETDSRYSFKNENVVFVNKANSTYRAESSRGEEFLLRHIIGIVAEALAETKHPEGKDALELQNRLVAEAIRIHDRSFSRK
jgi:hypothetical protein